VKPALLLALASLCAAEPGLEITVYNDDHALVKDRRPLGLPKGRSSLPWEGVAQTLDASSASFSSPAARVLEQNYRYDLVSRSVLLQKYLGREVTLVEDATADGKLPVRERRGRILSLEGDRITSLESEGKILLDPPGRVVLPSLPEGLQVQPTLVLDLQSPKGGTAEAELRYLCSGLSWQADYVAVLDSADKKLDLDGLVTLSNHSGTAFKDAHLKLVAGEVNRIPEPRRLRAEPMFLAKAALPEVASGGGEDESTNGFQEQGLMEYHLYDLGRPTTLRDNEQKQISLLSAQGATAKKRYVFDESLTSRYWWWSREDTKDGRKLAVMVDIPNSEANRLGMALPKGKVRVYKADRSGALQFIGEDRIEHTAKDDTLHLALGKTFDLSGTRVVKNSSTVKDERTETVSVTLKNSKDEAVEVEVVEHQAWPDWKVKEASQSYDKKDASTLVFKVKVPAHGHAEVWYSYRARI
jgi:hypothetical protein